MGFRLADDISPAVPMSVDNISPDVPLNVSLPANPIAQADHHMSVDDLHLWQPDIQPEDIEEEEDDDWMFGLPINDWTADQRVEAELVFLRNYLQYFTDSSVEDRLSLEAFERMARTRGIDLLQLLRTMRSFEPRRHDVADIHDSRGDGNCLYYSVSYGLMCNENCFASSLRISGSEEPSTV
jgi:hypothetical protein